ncbi:Extracellular metalloprotease GLRG_06286; Flags: Precursor [Serendipita indica DSM 11827]|nr:Extracellular metalloprotease GLRG_06286; Flags: Precursor [Serendipita indica DSM 11827]
MHLPLLFAFIISFWLASATSSDTENRQCGMHVDGSEVHRIQQEVSSMNSTSRADDDARLNPIPIAVSALNSHFAGTGISFYLQSVSRNWQSTWYSGATKGSQAEIQMKNALYAGGKRTLNVYSVGTSTLGYGGPWPWDYYKNPKLDGVVIKHTTMPGGSETNYNQGKWLTHVVGHWIGLFDVFEGLSCSGIGDAVNDTPMQRTPSYGCPAGKDSCPNSWGVDSIHNYMDFTFDSCQTGFTNGQMVFARFLLQGYRP